MENIIIIGILIIAVVIGVIYTVKHFRGERVLNEMDGVAGKVNLSKKQAIASMEKEVSDDAIFAC